MTINKALSPNSHTKRQLIIDAAAMLFSQQGFDGTSLKQIADIAGFNKSLVQYHFPNKLALWQASVSDIWQQRNLALPQYLQDYSQLQADSKKQMVRDLCKGLLAFSFAHPAWIKIMFLEASKPGPRLDWMVTEFFTQDFEQGQAMIELAQQEGLLPDVDPMDLLHILSGALIYLINVAPISAKVLNCDPTDEAYIDHHVDSLMRILQPG